MSKFTCNTFFHFLSCCTGKSYNEKTRAWETTYIGTFTNNIDGTIITRTYWPDDDAVLSESSREGVIGQTKTSVFRHDLVEKEYKVWKKSNSGEVTIINFLNKEYPSVYKTEEIVLNAQLLPREIIDSEEDVYCQDDMEYNVPKYVEMMIYSAVVESATCEHAARRMANGRDTGISVIPE